MNSVPPDELVAVLTEIHNRLQPGGTLETQVRTDLTGEASETSHFCAATYMTAFRRAGFDFERVDRVLLDEEGPSSTQPGEQMRFHDPLELRTAALDAVLVRPDRVNLSDLELANEAADAGEEGAGFAHEQGQLARIDKRTPEWGERRAQSLWDNLYGPWIEDADGRSFLDIGCSWGYLFQYMLDRCSPRLLVGVDVIAHWEGSPFDWQKEKRAQISFLRTDLLGASLEPGSFDYVLSASVLQFLSPAQLRRTLRRIRELLRPGGELLLRTQVFTSHLGLLLHRVYRLPYVHLLHGEDTLRRRMENLGSPRRQTNWLTATSYLQAFLDAGFEILAVNRHRNHHSPAVLQRVLDDFPVSENEMTVSELSARLARR